jgi:restriction endonuclease S subunit
MSAIAEFIDTLEDKIEKLLQKMKSLERNNQDFKTN